MPPCSSCWFLSSSNYWHIAEIFCAATYVSARHVCAYARNAFFYQSASSVGHMTPSWWWKCLVEPWQSLSLIAICIVLQYSFMSQGNKGHVESVVNSGHQMIMLPAVSRSIDVRKRPVKIVQLLLEPLSVVDTSNVLG